MMYGRSFTKIAQIFPIRQQIWPPVQNQFVFAGNLGRAIRTQFIAHWVLWRYKRHRQNTKTNRKHSNYTQNALTSRQCLNNIILLLYFLCDNFQLQILSSMVSQPFNCVNWLSLCFSRQNLRSLPRLFQNRPFQNVLLTLLLQPILSINV